MAATMASYAACGVVDESYGIAVADGEGPHARGEVSELVVGMKGRLLVLAAAFPPLGKRAGDPSESGNGAGVCGAGAGRACCSRRPRSKGRRRGGRRKTSRHQAMAAVDSRLVINTQGITRTITRVLATVTNTVMCGMYSVNRHPEAGSRRRLVNRRSLRCPVY